MQPMSCSRINFASSTTGVLGLTQSTPLCITSLTLMADLRCWISGALDAMQHSSPLSHPYTRSGAPAPQGAGGRKPTRSSPSRSGKTQIRHAHAADADRCRQLAAAHIENEAVIVGAEAEFDGRAFAAPI